MLILLLFALPACTSPDPVTPTPVPARPLTATLGEDEIELTVPGGWFSYADAAHLMLTEHQPSTDGSVIPDGTSIHLWLPQLGLDPADTPVTESDGKTNLAHALLEYVVKSHDLPHHTHPTPFEWAGHDAAFYIVTGEEAMQVIVIALEIPHRNQVLTMNITTMREDLDALPGWLDLIFRDFRLGSTVFATDGLEAVLEALAAASPSADSSDRARTPQGIVTAAYP
jgi:hypothetical protein